MSSHTFITFTVAPISCLWHTRQMSEVSCSLSEQEFHPKLPNVLELLGSRPFQVLPYLYSYTGHTSVTYALSELTLTHMINVISIICRPSRASWHSRAVRLWLISSSSLGSWYSRAVRLWFISIFAFNLCSLCFFNIELSRWSDSRTLNFSRSELKIYYSQ
jgi:hypothetical protein